MIKKKVIDPHCLPCVMEAVEAIITNYHPDKIILFGPYQKGNISKRSEINLFVIKDSYLPRNERTTEILPFIPNGNVPVDIVVLTPVEFERGLLDRNCFLYTVIKESSVMYDKELGGEIVKAIKA